MHLEKTVKTNFFFKFGFAKSMILANAVFWMMFAVTFVIESYPYRPRRLHFEEVTPVYIFFGRAFPVIDGGTGVGLMPPAIKLIYAIQKPSILAAIPYYSYFNGRGITVDREYWGISVGGYFLVLVCVISFVQWGLIGLLIDYTRLLIRIRRR